MPKKQNFSSIPKWERKKSIFNSEKWKESVERKRGDFLRTTGPSVGWKIDDDTTAAAGRIHWLPRFSTQKDRGEIQIFAC